MKSTLAIVLLSALLAAMIAGAYLTRSDNPPAAISISAQEPKVDLQPLRTAQQLARLAEPGDEQLLAQEALRVADVDADFALREAVRETTANPPKPNAKMKASLDRLQKAQLLVQNDNAEIARLTAQKAKAPGQQKDQLDEQIAAVQAELEIDQDEADDAKSDYDRAGGDVLERLKAMMAEHGSATQNVTAPPAIVVPIRPGWVRQFQEWRRLRGKRARLAQALNDAMKNAALLTQLHQAVAELVKSTRAQPTSSENTHQRSAMLAESAATMAGFDKRFENQQQLTSIYNRWDALVATQSRSTLHGVLNGISVMLGTALVLLIASVSITTYFKRLSSERSRLHSIRGLLQTALLLGGLAIVLLILFGPPNQLSTLFGLMGAALTFVMRDFVVGLVGWFVLMGEHGLRVGDWVEIEGVAGEVVEIGLFRTVLLETGNWTDASHPTGRRVTFANSFAIGGHYFNFSTGGQWLWDEVKIVVPTGRDPMPVAEAIQKTATQETAEDARIAEEEWRAVATNKGLSTFSADPVVNVRPGELGLEVVVRYIARAAKRNALREKLYREAVDLVR